LNDRVLRAFFQEDQDIGQIDVLTKLAEAIGLNGAEFKAVLETRKYRTVHQQALEYATEQIGINSVPTFMIGDRILSGLLSKETLEQAIGAAMEGDRDKDD
jgi:predicted DsbA family dithiol-disulfide isomerase